MAGPCSHRGSLGVFAGTDRGQIGLIFLNQADGIGRYDSVNIGVVLPEGQNEPPSGWPEVVFLVYPVPGRVGLRLIDGQVPSSLSTALQSVIFSDAIAPHLWE